jgi:hypothetical protein
VLVRLADNKRLAPSASNSLERLLTSDPKADSTASGALLGQALWAMSVGEVRFIDPTAGPVEHLPSLLMPFWQANLTSVQPQDQGAAILAAGRRAGS